MIGSYQASPHNDGYHVCQSPSGSSTLSRRSFLTPHHCRISKVGEEKISSQFSLATIYQPCINLGWSYYFASACGAKITPRALVARPNDRYPEMHFGKALPWQPLDQRGHVFLKVDGAFQNDWVWVPSVTEQGILM